MAISILGSDKATNDGNATITRAYTNHTGTAGQRLILAAQIWSNATTLLSGSTLTYGGTSLSAIASMGLEQTSSGVSGLKLYLMADTNMPSVGSNNFVSTLPSTPQRHRLLTIELDAATQGVESGGSTPVIAVYSGTTDTPSIAPTTIANNALIITVINHNASTTIGTPTNGQSLVQSHPSASGIVDIMTSELLVTAGSDTQNGVQFGATASRGIIASVSVAPYGGLLAATTMRHRRSAS